MRLLALTDARDSKKQEFVVVEKIQHIQRFELTVWAKPEEMKLIGYEPQGFFRTLFKLDKIPIFYEFKTLTGSTIYMDNGRSTNVFETPENIAEMLNEGNFLTVEEGK